MKTFTSVVNINLIGNELSAKNKEDYIQKMKIKMYHELGLEIDAFEITEIEEV